MDTPDDQACRKAARVETIKAYGASLLATTLFGLSFLFLKIALEANGGRVFDILSYRFLIGSAVMLFLLRAGLVQTRFRGKDWRGLLLMCLLNPALYFTLEILGVSRVASSEAGMMLAVLPVTTTILGILFLGERIRFRQWFFALLSISGILLIQLCSYEPGNSSNLGRILLLLAILAGSAYSIVTKQLSSTYTATERTAAMIFSGAVFFTILAFLSDWRDKRLADYFANFVNPRVLLPILYLSLACSVIAFFLLNYAIGRLPVSRNSVMANFATVVSILAGVVFLQERFLWYHALGSVLIVTGVIGTTLVGQKRGGQKGINQKRGGRPAPPAP